MKQRWIEQAQKTLLPQFGRRKPMHHLLVRAANGQTQTAEGLTRRHLATDGNMQIVRSHLLGGVTIGPHRHWNAQSGYVLSGSLRVRFGRYDEILGPGDSYTIPSETEHSLHAIGPAEVIEFFTL